MDFLKRKFRGKDSNQEGKPTNAITGNDEWYTPGEKQAYVPNTTDMIKVAHEKGWEIDEETARRLLSDYSVRSYDDLKGIVAAVNAFSGKKSR